MKQPYIPSCSQFGKVTLLVRRRPAPQALEEAAMGDEQVV